MAMTLDEKIALINKKRAGDKSVAERKQRRRDREVELVKKKHSHDWHSVWGTHDGQNGGKAGSRVPLFCKRCRINYQAFKAQPQSCDEFLIRDVIE